MAPRFFLPYLSPESEEASFAHLAKQCERAIPAPGAGVYSISFERGGTTWIATVGEQLRGRKPIRVKRNETGQWRHIRDTASVLAIFPGEPYIVVTHPGSNSHFRGTRVYATSTGVELFSLEA
jgi:hypothetical protein